MAPRFPPKRRSVCSTGIWNWAAARWIQPRVYGTWGPTGRAVSEETIGAWLRSRGSRSRVTLVTKGGHPPLSDMHRSRLSETEIRTDIEESLRTLGTDWVELFLLHRDEVSRPAEEIVDTLDRLVKEGKALAVGVSNWTAERIEEANLLCAPRRQNAACRFPNPVELRPHHSAASGRYHTGMHERRRICPVP